MILPSKNVMAYTMSDIIRQEIQVLSAYHVPPAEDLIKLDAMENPYALPDDIQSLWLDVLAKAEINRYPDPAAHKLSEKIKQVMQVPDDQDVILGNGSDELIQIMAMAVAKPGRSILAPEPGFVMYKMIATFVGMNYIGVPLEEDFSLDMDATLSAIKSHQPALIFLAYPNNPTGNCFAEDDIISILNTAEGLVVLDEAYHPFSNHSFMSRLGEFENLLVMRTVSKMGMAGLRLGMLAGAKKWIIEFDKIRLPYNINVLTQLSVEFALEHNDVFEQQAQLICQQREVLLTALAAMDNIQVYPSQANFILIRLLSADANDVFECLKKQGILIKNLHPAGASLQQCLRLTVGTPIQNERCLQVLKQCL